MDLVTIVEGDPKAPFSIAITPKYWGGATHFPKLLHFTLDPYKQINIKKDLASNDPQELIYHKTSINKKSFYFLLMPMEKV